MNNFERWFKEHPQFRHFFYMNIEKNHKFQGMWMLLLQTTKIKKRKKLWFIVNGVPIRYGLREHALIFRLNCQNYPLSYKEFGSTDLVKEHFKGSIRLEDVKVKLQKMGAHEDRLNIVPWLILTTARPWGRYSFDYMVKEISHTMDHFGGVVGEKVLWPLPGLCLPFELLAFEAIPQLGISFRESVLDADVNCPRMCKSTFKPSEMKGFPLSKINDVLGKTKEIYSILPTINDEEKDLLAELTEEEDDVGRPGLAVDSWVKHLDEGFTVFFEDMYKKDVAAREEEEPHEIPAETPGGTQSTKLAEVLKIIIDIGDQMKRVEEKVNGFDERLVVVEAFVKEEEGKRNGE